ncbi:MAG: hypothetical protein F6K42_29320 [Leptolyngbya sp. SIO1D8]|nr:hypothetical protein [Leptolyngbya sp. SIO1D8]
MTNKIGFDFDEFGGNVDVVILESNQDDLNNSSYMREIRGDGYFRQIEGQTWSVLVVSSYFPAQIEIVARELSQELSTKAIHFYYGDASGWMGYTLFENGHESESFSFGESYDEEMAEMGMDPGEHTRRDGTIVATNNVDDQFIFWSQSRSKTEMEICAGEKIIDEFLRIHNVYIGWDLFPGS